MSWFEQAYAGTPPWEIGRPQGEIVRLQRSDRIGRRVLDVGCGTGENALFLAQRGHEVLGVDIAPSAIEKAKAKAAARGLKATFRLLDALRLNELEGAFDTVIDSGLFHSFSDEERPPFVRGLAAVLKPGGSYVMLAFSEREPGSDGPRRVTQAEIKATFADAWEVEEIREAAFETRPPHARRRAWLSIVARKQEVHTRELQREDAAA
jgi:cyclopropane fatty-acyl-phospholipid synthase-like methyltransferase